MTTFYLQNVRILDHARNRDKIADLCARRDDRRLLLLPPDVPRINADGLLVAPGFWDVHVHFRDPGAPAAETRRTGAACSCGRRIHARS